jgi:hypothetical protein
MPLRANLAAAATATASATAADLLLSSFQIAL